MKHVGKSATGGDVYKREKAGRGWWVKIRHPDTGDTEKVGAYGDTKEAASAFVLREYGDVEILSITAR